MADNPSSFIDPRLLTLTEEDVAWLEAAVAAENAHRAGGEAPPAEAGPPAGAHDPFPPLDPRLATPPAEDFFAPFAGHPAIGEGEAPTGPEPEPAAAPTTPFEGHFDAALAHLARAQDFLAFSAAADPRVAPGAAGDDDGEDRMDLDPMAMGQILPPEGHPGLLLENPPPLLLQNEPFLLGPAPPLREPSPFDLAAPDPAAPAIDFAAANAAAEEEVRRRRRLLARAEAARQRWADQLPPANDNNPYGVRFDGGAYGVTFDAVGGGAGARAVEREGPGGRRESMHQHLRGILLEGTDLERVLLPGEARQSRFALEKGGEGAMEEEEE